MKWEGFFSFTARRQCSAFKPVVLVVIIFLNTCNHSYIKYVRQFDVFFVENVGYSKKKITHDLKCQNNNFHESSLPFS